MFEKEAEQFKRKTQKQYREAQENGYMPSLWANIDNIWQSGAIFGYNKAKIEDDIQQEKLFAHYVYARSLISDLLRNSDEYARQRAEEFIDKEGIPPKE